MNTSKNLNKGYYKLMQLYSFKDLGDLGSYDGCKELSDVATYTVLNMNITQLPVDIRIGLCLPKECTQEMYDLAQDPISDTISKSAFFTANLLKIGFAVKYHVGFVVSFIQPSAWAETQAVEKTTGAAIVLSIMGVFFILGLSLSLFEYFRKEQKLLSSGNEKPSQNELNYIERILDANDTIERGSTRAVTMRNRLQQQTTTISLRNSPDDRNDQHIENLIDSAETKLST
jgi:hypothetical protein